MRLRNWLIILPTVVSLAFLLGCGGFGEVDQGRVIDYDPEKGLITFIRDSNFTDPNNPKYDVLPPATVRVPVDPAEMGPAPEAGMRMSLDSQNSQVVVFDPAARDFKTIDYTLIEQHDNVYADDARVSSAELPVIDRQKRTITLYSRRTRELVTFSVSDEYFDLPDDTWKAGDEIRYYYKEPGQALRLMNVTRMDLT